MLPYAIPRVVRFIEAENRLVSAWAWEEQNGEILLNDDRASVLQDDKILEMDGGCWLHNNVNVLNATEF